MLTLVVEGRENPAVQALVISGLVDRQSQNKQVFIDFMPCAEYWANLCRSVLLSILKYDKIWLK